MASMQEQTDLVVDLVNDRADKAETFLAQTTALIESVRGAINAAITQLASYTPSFNVGGVDTTYVGTTVDAPTIPSSIPGLDTTYVPVVVTPPTIPSEVPGIDVAYVAPTEIAPTVPSAVTVAIGDVEWDRIFQRAAAQEARVGIAEEYTAESEAAARGMAIPTFVANPMIALAQQRTMDRISAVAETSAIEQAKAAREDIIKLTELGLDLFAKEWGTQTQSEAVRQTFEKLKIEDVVDLAKLQADMYSAEVDANSKSETTRLGYENLKVTSVTELSKVQALVYEAEVRAASQSEATRVEYERLELEKSMQPDKFRAEYALKQMELVTVNSVGQLVDLVQVYAQLTNALFSASNVDLGSRASMELRPITYNPTQGEVLSAPI